MLNVKSCCENVYGFNQLLSVIYYIHLSRVRSKTERLVAFIAKHSLTTIPGANDESSEVFDIIKPGRRVKIKGHRQ